MFKWAPPANYRPFLYGALLHVFGTRNSAATLTVDQYLTFAQHKVHNSNRLALARSFMACQPNGITLGVTIYITYSLCEIYTLSIFSKDKHTVCIKLNFQALGATLSLFHNMAQADLLGKF
jgi:hypothetical protein